MDRQRRRFLLGLTALPVAGLAAGTTPFFAAHGIPLGLQLYTVADAVQQDLEGTFLRLARIGYRTVELASLHGHSATQLRAAADRAGLAITSLHVPAQPSASGPGLAGDLAPLIAIARTLGARDVVMPMFALPARSGGKRADESFVEYLGRVSRQLTPEDWRGTAAFLEQRGAALRAAGLRLSYHNHNPEFAPLGGTSGMEILLQGTSRQNVGFELDVGWVAAAGQDPVALLRANPGRFGLMHVKDIRASTRPNFTLQQDPTEVGSGMLDWPRLLREAHAAGVRSYFVEQEPPFERDRFDSVALSLRYLAGI